MPKRRAGRRRSVYLFVDINTGYGEGVLRGFSEYARSRNWSWRAADLHFARHLPPRRGEADGVVFQELERDFARALARTGIPGVAVAELDAGLGFSKVVVDATEVAELVAGHFLPRRFRHFAFCGLVHAPFSRRREDAFRAALELRGHALHVHNAGLHRGRWMPQQERDALVAWLRDLPKPVALMTCNDFRGLQVLHACEEAGILVPEQVAVAGVDNEKYCGLFDPSLSSVAVDARRVGAVAARVLQDLWRAHGGARPRTETISPLRLVGRRSSDAYAFDDPELAQALRFIHREACRGIQVGDVARDLTGSRRRLEMRFRRTLGRTIHSEIQRVRMEEACRLLIESDLGMRQIQRAVGLATPSHFAHLFRATFGESPRNYRRRARDGG